MYVVITYPTALEYWLRLGTKAHPLLSFGEIQAAEGDDYMQKEDISEALAAIGLKPPFHVLVPSGNMRRRGEGVFFHVLPESLQNKSFVKLISAVYIICPELTFMLSINNNSLAGSVVTANNLCARFLPDPSTPFGQKHRTPITNTAKIKSFADSQNNVPGKQRVLKLVPYVSDNSNSPMESKLAALLSLPVSKGGYGIVKPALNRDVALASDAASLLGRKCCCVDMLWEKEKIIIEYDSNLAHLSADQHYYDKKRLTALSISGYTVISITSENLRSPKAVDNLFISIRKALGLNARTDRFEKYKGIRHQTIKGIIYSF